MANQETGNRHVVTGEVRLSYVHLLKPYAKTPDQDEKYSVTVLVPKSDTATKQRIDAAIEAAMQDGAARLWNGVRYAVHPVYDGDGRRPNGTDFGDECRGHWVFTATCKADRPPRIVDANVQDILDPTKVYSGVYGRVGVDFYAYNNPNKKGVGCGLTNVQILRDGEPLTARSATAEEDFGAPQTAPAAQYGYQPPRIDPITGLSLQETF